MNRKQFLLQAFILACFFQFSFFIFSANAQVTIGGEAEPAKGTVLDLSPSGGYVGGLKLPNVSLDNLSTMPNAFTDKSAITDLSKLKGLQVYNTNTTLGEGVYIWNGTVWYKSELGNEKYATKINLAADVTIDKIGEYNKLASFTVPRAGVYLVFSMVRFRPDVVGNISVGTHLFYSDTNSLILYGASAVENTVSNSTSTISFSGYFITDGAKMIDWTFESTATGTVRAIGSNWLQIVEL
ncbi:hypothetical protein D0T49_07240 [Paludibacter sp. 221]|uniref:hypothetical protein n=1 Tax=Paludibacter sp. 221 TaxID=2302939 RepID=UPI0013D2990F|nr:hypothetical protein [Paludibacter sp. 221]NDV46840.1 hypothetical protein [Paludibacter sp. 221]